MKGIPMKGIPEFDNVFVSPVNGNAVRRPSQQYTFDLLQSAGEMGGHPVYSVVRENVALEDMLDWLGIPHTIVVMRGLLFTERIGKIDDKKEEEKND